MTVEFPEEYYARNDDEKQEEFFIEKKLSIVNEEILSDVQTPAFMDKIPNKNNINTLKLIKDK